MAAEVSEETLPCAWLWVVSVPGEQGGGKSHGKGARREENQRTRSPENDQSPNSRALSS